MELQGNNLLLGRNNSQRELVPQREVIGKVISVLWRASQPEAPVTNTSPSQLLELIQGSLSGQESGIEGESSMSVEENHIFFKGANPQEWYKAAFALVPDTSPQQFRATVTECPYPPYIGKTALGILALNGDRMSFVANEPGVETTPAGFEGDSDSRYFVFRRVTPDAEEKAPD
jgi:hypothetical protein